ncbi:hypothetical protein SPHINGO8BC_70014 [Sphingobacterium multivorum]|uniref:Uncharacterized protein n=1 Tax=Sphingobacterium multivorum TaxID=28454 RepID=A0A654DKE3_SPHMU|nr:hypothetical protein SPHINGO8BC_70014 [Sphingobacterium multivorum]
MHNQRKPFRLDKHQITQKKVYFIKNDKNRVITLFCTAIEARCYSN